MKQFTKRGLAVLLAMALCISLLSGLVFAENAGQVSYVTGDATGFSNVIANWGQRGTIATFLSPNAETFYEKNDVTYKSLAELSSTALYTELQELMTSNHKVITSYGDTRDLYRFTDSQNSNTSAISSFYSGKSIGPSWDSGATWNREHTWPDSKGLNGSDEDDIMMLRPTASSENSARGNKAYGEGSGYYDPNSVSGGTYDLHGDVARIMLYTYVRWGNTGLYGTDGVIESRELLLKWMQEDPVDTWEMGRNDSVESITGTRNVFVDYPELAFVLLEDEVPADMITPSGEGYNGYAVTANVNDSALGSVVVSGRAITAFPAEGCRVTGYTVASGDAVVSQDGNVFVVEPSSDCTIYINFEARDGMTVRFMENGTEAGSQSAYYGDVITLPDHSGAIAEGYSFEGWVTAKLNETSAEPETVYSAGTGYTVKSNTTLYALYSRVDSSSAGQSSVYNIYVGEPEEGDYLIVSNGGALKASVTKNRFDFTNVTINGGSASNPAEDIIWHIEPTGDGYFTIYNESTGSYAGGSGTKNQGKLLTSVTDYAKWTISESQVFENVGNKTKGVNYTLRRNADYGFACYAASTGTGMTLYKLAGGTVYYTTTTGDGCQHINTTDVPAENPGCTTPGFTAGVFCNDCQSYISGHEQIGATGHSYEAVVTPATENEQGYTTYTCPGCGDSYVSDYTDALKDIHDVTFNVPFGVDAVDTVECGTKGIVLPTAGTPSGDYEYTFVGWTTAVVDNADVKPEIMKAGSTFTTDSDVVLHALYSYAPEGSGTGEWMLVSNASDLYEGAQIVIASNASGFVAGPVSGKFLTNLEASFSADMSIITALPEGAVILTLGGSDDAWTLTNADGSLLGASASKNVGWDKGTTTWSITIDGGDATIQNGTQSNGRFLYNVNSPRFTTYTSDTNKSMLLPQLYMLDGAVGTVYYTTVIACVHSGEFVPAVPADCQNAGTIAHYLCDGCGKFFADAEFTEELESVADPQKEHTFGDFQADENGHWKSCGCGEKSEEGSHAYGEWTIVQAPAVGVDGSRERFCGTCGYKQTEVIPGELIPETNDAVQHVLWIMLSITVVCAVIVPVFGMKKDKRF